MLLPEGRVEGRSAEELRRLVVELLGEVVRLREQGGAGGAVAGAWG